MTQADKKAIEIAKHHISKANPSHWDGAGEKPDTFDPRIATYQLDSDTELDISFEKDDNGTWLHLYELRDRSSEELMGVQSGEGVSSPEQLAETIAELCDGWL